MSLTKVTIVGGHGKVALRLATLLTKTKAHSVTSIIRSAEQIADLKAASPEINPLLLSLEDASVAEFSKAFTGTDVVVFSAGAGGKGGPERTKTVDHDGAVKVFNAIEAVNGAKPRLLLVSALDVRNPDVIPAHYDEDDIALSKRVRGAIPAYYKWKYEADKNLVARTAFKWSIVRPGGLSDEAGTGKATIGRTHMRPVIPRDDVALALRYLVDRPDAAGLAVDMVGGGEISVEQGLDAFIKKGETDFLG